MDADQARDFLRSNHRAVLATSRADGTPALAPVSTTVDSHGYAVVSTRETAMKTKHLRRDPWATLCVLNDGFYGDWLYVAGPTEIVALPDAMEPLVDYYRSISGEHPDWDDYRAAMVRDQRVLLRITIERVGPTVSG